MRVMPIPIHLLPHTAILQKVTLNAWQEEVAAGDPIPLNYVRLDLTKTIKKDKDNNEIQLNALLFFDAVNSKPVPTDFAIGDQLTFNGQVYHVKTVEPAYAFASVPHHWEIGLV